MKNLAKLIGTRVTLKGDINLISLMELKGQELLVVDTVPTGLISTPRFLVVKNADNKIFEINPDYLTSI